MKTKLKLFVIFLLSWNFIQAQDSKKYVYPNFGEWKQMKTHQEKINLFLIPKDKLASMTSPELLQAYVDYPLLFDFYAYNDMEQGWRSMSKQCNSLAELLLRKDCAITLLDYYSKNGLPDVESSSKSAKSYFKIRAIEIALGSKESMQYMNTEDGKKVVKAMLNVLKYKQKDTNSYSVLDTSVLTTTGGRIVKNFSKEKIANLSSKNKDGIMIGIEKGLALDNESFDELLVIMNEFASN